MGGQHIGSPLNGLVGAGVGSNLLFLEAYFHHVLMGGQHIGSPLNGLVGAGVGSNLLFLEAYFHHDDRVRVGGGVCAGGGRVGRSQISQGVYGGWYRWG